MNPDRPQLWNAAKTPSAAGDRYKALFESSLDTILLLGENGSGEANPAARTLLQIHDARTESIRLPFLLNGRPTEALRTPPCGHTSRLP